MNGFAGAGPLRLICLQGMRLVLGLIAAAAVAMIVWIAAAGRGIWGPLVLLVLAASVSLYARHQLKLMRRAQVGLRSERKVARYLKANLPAGWKLKNGVNWPKNGDIDHLLLGPGAQAVAVETKTTRYTSEHLKRCRSAAGYVTKRYRRQAQSIMVLARAHNVSELQDGVLVISLDRLGGFLSDLAGDTARSDTEVVDREHLDIPGQLEAILRPEPAPIIKEEAVLASANDSADLPSAFIGKPAPRQYPKGYELN